MSGDSMSDMDPFLSLAMTFVTFLEEAVLKKVLDTLRDVAYSMESPEDTIQRIMFYVRNLVRANAGILHLQP